MNLKDLTHIAFRFVPVGTVAPDPVAENEIWVDVGNRADFQVLDHHGGDTTAWCSAQLVMDRFADLIQLPHLRKKDLTTVLHSDPDLDAICAAWLIQKITLNSDFDSCRQTIETMVAAVGENDQGFIRTDRPEKCWPIVMRLLIGVEFRDFDDEDKLKAIFPILDRTLALLLEGKSLNDTVEHVTTLTVKTVTAQAERDYWEDLSRALTFQLRLPISVTHNDPYLHEQSLLLNPKLKSSRWSLADALYLENPTSALFKELARGDRANSTFKQGFQLLVVAQDLDAETDHPLQRYIISTDPASGLNLKGLGRKLETGEQEKENRSDLPLLPGRERVPDGKGRHGYNVMSPWYDGRGHNFTIVDSPSIVVGEHNVCASCLTPAEVLETIWQYGNPARFIKALEPELFLLYPAKLSMGWEDNWSENIEISDLCAELGDETCMSLKIIGMNQFYLNEGLLNNTPLPLDGVALSGQMLFPLDANNALWIGKISLDSSTGTFRDLQQVLGTIRRFHPKPLIPDGVILQPTAEAFHLVFVRSKASDLSLEDSSGYSAEAQYLLSSAQKPGFHNRPVSAELESAIKVLSRDHSRIMWTTESGAVITTTTPSFIEQEKSAILVMLSLAMALKYSIEEIIRDYARHRSEGDPVSAGRAIITDRLKMMRLEQDLTFAKVTDWIFGRRVYEAFIRVLNIKEVFEDTKTKIASLAEHVRDAKADFFQKIAFWVSVLFAPLAITAGFFSGTHMEKNYPEGHHTFMLSYQQYSGWIQFLIVFLCISCGLCLLWIIIRLGYTRKNPLQWFRKKNRDLER